MSSSARHARSNRAARCSARRDRPAARPADPRPRGRGGGRRRRLRGTRCGAPVGRGAAACRSRSKSHQPAEVDRRRRLPLAVDELQGEGIRELPGTQPGGRRRDRAQIGDLSASAARGARDGRIERAASLGGPRLVWCSFVENPNPFTARQAVADRAEISRHASQRYRGFEAGQRPRRLRGLTASPTASPGTSTRGEAGRSVDASSRSAKVCAASGCRPGMMCW